MGNLLLIGMGGFIGATLRYTLSGLVQSLSKSTQFPFGTLAVNLVGCLLIGALSYLAESYNTFSPETHSLVFLGFLGAFTTFSTFSSESLTLLRDGQNLLSYLNIGIHVLFGLGAVWLGRAMAALLSS